MELKKAILKADLIRIDTKDLCILISVLNDIQREEFNEHSRIKGVMLGEIRNYATDHLLRRYIIDYEKNPAAEAEL